MGLMKKLTSALVASSLVLSLAGSAFAAYTPNAGTEAGMRMMELKILKGRPGDDKLAVNAELTRAELVTIIVRAFGKEADAQLLKGAPAFPDTAAHWASGEIAMAKALVEKAGADAIGMPDGTFAPDAKLTPAQAVAFLMKFMGIQRDTTKSWPADYLDAAVAAGLITAEDKATIAPMVNENATRGLAFYLFDNAFYSYELPNGKTFYTTYADTEAPALTATAEATTMDSKVTVTGTVGTDAVAVYVGSTKVTPDANGAFSADVALAEVKEYDILVTAADVAGNVAEKTLTVARIIGTASAIEASDITVAAGATVDVAAAVKDAKGNTVADAVVTGTSSVGTFADGKFTANTAVATGTLVLKSGEIEKTVNVTVTAGALAKVTADKTSVGIGEKATLTATDEYGNKIEGVTYTMDSADANVGTTNGVFIGSKAGVYTVTATKGDATATIKVGIYGTASKFTVTAPASVVANTTLSSGNYAAGTLVDVTYAVVDANGNAVTTDDSTVITLSGSGLVFFVPDSNGKVAVGTAPVTTATVTDGVVKLKVGALTTVPGQSILVSGTASGLTAGTATMTTNFRVATKVVISGLNSAYATNTGGTTSDTVTVKVQDQNSVDMGTGYGATASVTVTGPVTMDDMSTKTKTLTLINGAATFVPYVAQGQTGDVTVTATIEGIGTATANSKAVVAGNVVTLKASISDLADAAISGAQKADGTFYKVNLSAVDANGVSGYNAPTNVTVDFGGVDLTGVSFKNATGSAITTTDGKLTVALADGFFQVASTTFLNTLPINVTASGYNSASASIAFQAGAASKLGLTLNNDSVPSGSNYRFIVPVANTASTLSAQLYDGQGNKVAKAGVNVTFKAYLADSDDTLPTSTSGDVTLNGTAGTVTVQTDANGVATANVVARPYVGNAYTVVVSTDATGITVLSATKDRVSFKITNTVVTTSAVTVYAAGTSNIANTINPDSTSVNVKVTLTDNYGVAVSGMASYLKLNVGKVLWYSGATAFVDNTNGSTSYTFVEDPATAGTYWLGTVSGATLTKTAVNVAKAGLQTITVDYVGVETKISASSNVVVNSGAAAKLTVLDAGSAITAKTVKTGTVSGPYTLQLADQFGNAVATGAPITVNVTGGFIRATADGVDKASFTTTGTYTFYVAVPGNVSLTFASGSLTSGALAITAN